MSQPIYKAYTFEVTDKGQVVPTSRTSWDLDKNVAAITGIALNANQRGMLAGFGTQRLELSGQEIFPEGFPSFLLMSGIQTAPQTRFFRFANPLPFGTGKLAMQFRDTWQAPPAGQPDTWVPYTVTVLLEQQAYGAAAPAPTPSTR